MKSRAITVGFCVSAVVLLAGCADMFDPNSPANIAAAQRVSSGFTGCEPADNVITPNMGSPGWHAVCKGKTYVCTDVSPAARSSTFACAAAAQ
jgi:hypothetical protein